MDEGRIFEGAKFAAFKRLVVLHEIDKRMRINMHYLIGSVICGPVKIIALMDLLLVLSLCVTNFVLMEP